jgi:aryl-alcohol dehydrogenase-like predicted oxidoreductase
MRLSTRPGRDEVAARRLLERAVALGVRHFDTADAYALDEAEVGHNERLLAEVLPPDAHVATKAGLRRPGGAWVPDGRAKHLRAAAEASATRLGRPADLLLLHAVDPRTPLRTSARALARILRDGHARAVGVCNVSLGQLREALEHAPLSAVQNGLSPLDARAFGSGVPAFAREHGLELQAHSPFGGPRKAAGLATQPELAVLAEARGVTVHALVVAWLRDLGILPLPGPTTVAHLEEVLTPVPFDDALRGALQATAPHLAAPTRGAPPGPGRAVLIMGLPGAGKSALAKAHEGPVLERDRRREPLAATHEALRETLARDPSAEVALPNTYLTRAQRAEAIAAAAPYPVDGIWLETSPVDAQINLVLRLLRREGILLGGAALKAAERAGPDLLTPSAFFRLRRQLERPEEDEGFRGLEVRAFRRRPWPGTASGTLVSLEAVDDAGALDLGEGPVALLAWGPALGHRLEAVAAAVEARAGRALPRYVCPHGAGPPTCWCRKPLPGLVVQALLDRSIAPTASRWLGSGPADARLARAVGLHFVDLRRAP